MVEARFGRTYEDSYALLHKAALARARRIVGNDDDAEELAQEALLRAYGRWPEIAEYARAWVTRVVTNLAINQVRRKHQCSELPASASTDRSDTQLDVARALDALPLRQRQVVVLRHIADLSEGDTAEALGISVGAVKRHLHRATSALKELPELASAYRPGYAFTQKLAEYERWFVEHTISAPEPRGGWPAPPWDQRFFVNADGTVRLRAVDENEELILDADGNEVMTGAGFKYLLCKPLVGPGLPWPTPMVAPFDSLSEEVKDVLDRAWEIGTRLGSTLVDNVHLAIALAERLGDQPPLDLHHLRRGCALSSDGPHADARLARFAKREDEGWTLPKRPDVKPAELSCVRDLRHAAVQASRRGELVTCNDVVDAILRPLDLPAPPPLSAVYRVMRYSRENRYPAQISYD